METTLHRQLKALYATAGATQEARVAAFRVDVARPDTLVEIQTAPLAAIRDKVAALANDHPLLVVKPIAHRRYIVRLDRKPPRGGPHAAWLTDPPSRRLSPKRGSLLDVFLELVHFTRAFIHERLTMEVLLTEEEEWRLSARRSRRRVHRYTVIDRRLVRVLSHHRLDRPADLCSLLPPGLPQPFDTQELAAHLNRPRWFAQAVAYCLRETGAARVVEKRRNSLVYTLGQ